jgi:ectoine hydroxylase-related dioxygenase (phytanoyl-CoA dioxygenase family)
MNPSKLLTAQQIQFFHEEGYLIAPEVFAPEELEPLRRELAAAIEEKVGALQTDGKLTRTHTDLDFDRRLAAIYRDSKENGETVMRHLEGRNSGGFRAPEMFGVIAHPKLLAAVEALLGSGEIVASSVYRLRPKVPNVGRGVVPWHQDSGYFAASCDEHLIITCWVPLVDATVQNGCMRILPRTHQGRVVTHYNGGNAGFLVIKDEDLPDDPGRAIPAACPRGGVVFMTNRTPHCSTPNRSDHIRWSIDLRFQAASVPSNAHVWPASINAEGRADEEFYAKGNIACYPPEADFLVHSRAQPEAVTTYADFVRRRETYDRIKTGFGPIRDWPALR